MLSRHKRELANANSYDEWLDIASAIETANGMAAWKVEERTRLYDYLEVRSRRDNLQRLRKQGDVEGLILRLDEGVHGNIGGIGRSRLYKQSLFGTKDLVRSYVDEVVASLRIIADCSEDTISHADKLSFFERTSHCFGRSGFLMSGGGMLLYFPVGVARALLQQDLLPDVISGSSGGAYVAGILGTHDRSALLSLLSVEGISDRLRGLELSRPTRGRQRGSQALSDTELKKLLEHLVPDMTFAEAYAATGRHINIPVAPSRSHQTSHLLNSITTPNVYIHEAARASGALPGLYEPVTLAARGEGGRRTPYMASRRWVDGSISDDLPSKKMSRLFGANHFIVSQVNPHLLPFIADTHKERSAGSIIRDAQIKSARAWINASAVLFQTGVGKDLMTMKASIRLNYMLSIINQDYVGDINILPPFKFRIPVDVLQPPSKDDMQKLIDMGERAAWPKLEMIANQSKIGITLRSIIKELKASGSA